MTDMKFRKAPFDRHAIIQHITTVFRPPLPMTRPTLSLSSVSSLSALTAGALVFGGLLSPATFASPEPGDGVLSPWPIATETHSAAEFLTAALPVAANKSDIANGAAGFFRVPTATTHEPGTILYVGLRAEPAPTSGAYCAPLFSGSVESLDLGIGGAKATPRTVGDIGEIYADDAPPTPMAYIVYRLDFSTRGSDRVALFATPTVTTEPFTTRAPDELDANFAWEEIRFSDFEEIGDHQKDHNYDRNARDVRRTAKTAAAPEPSSAGLLALGLIGISLWRRQRAR